MCCVKHTLVMIQALLQFKSLKMLRWTGGKKPSWAEDSAWPGIHQRASQTKAIRRHKTLSFLTSVSKVTWTFSNSSYYSGYNLYGNVAYFQVFYPFIAYEKKKNPKTPTLVNLQTLWATKLWMIDRFILCAVNPKYRAAQTFSRLWFRVWELCLFLCFLLS